MSYFTDPMAAIEEAQFVANATQQKMFVVYVLESIGLRSLIAIVLLFFYLRLVLYLLLACTERNEMI